MKVKKIKIAITGNIGSGKSTFSEYISSKGFHVINADDLSKNILASDAGVRKKIINSFGESAYKNDYVNTEFLAEKVFSNKENLQKINSILHPVVIKKTDLLSDQYFKSNNIVFVEAALIYEAKIEKHFNFIVVIASDFEIRKQRIISSGKFSAAQFESRDSNQVDQEIKIKKADFVFFNNDSVDNLKKRADLFLITLKSLSAN